MRKEFSRAVKVARLRHATGADKIIRCEGCGVDAERFSGRIRRSGPDDCWEWQGRLDDNGYGRIDCWNGRRSLPLLSHRIAYQIAKGEAPPRELSVCHSCDNPSCCNPAHLWLGTQADNNADMNAKGRRVPIRVRRGSEVNTSRLTQDQAIDVFLSVGALKEIGRRFGISGTAVHWIKIGKNWRDATIGLTPGAGAR